MSLAEALSGFNKTTHVKPKIIEDLDVR